MNFKPHLWLPETRLEFVNYGDSPITLCSSVKPRENVFGKTFILEPHTKHTIIVKELLPAYVTDPSAIPENKLLLNFKNSGNTSCSIDGMDIGPFKVSPELTVIDKPQKLINLYDEYLDNSDLYNIAEVLKTPIPEEFKQNLDFYSAINYKRGSMCGKTLRIEEADKYFEEAWKYSSHKNRRVFSYVWVTNLMYSIGSPDAAPDIKYKMIQKILKVLDLVLESTKGLKYEHYHRIGVACLRAFLLCYLDEGSRALELLDDLEYPAIAKDELNEEELSNVLGNIVYGQMVAVELKNGKLMRNLCNLVASGAEDINGDLSPVFLFEHTGAGIFESGITTMNAAFENILKICNNYAPEFPNLREFVKLRIAKDLTALEYFIP